MRSLQTPEQPPPAVTPNAPKKATAAKRRIPVGEPKEKNSNGFEIVTLPGAYTSNPPKRAKKSPTEEQISPAYKVSGEINVYSLTKKWDRGAARDYVQIEKAYVSSTSGAPGIYTFSFDINYLSTMIMALDKIKEHYASCETENEIDSDDGAGDPDEDGSDDE